MTQLTETEKMAITKYDLFYEQRVSKLESTMENLSYDVKEIKKDMKADFRWLLLMMITLLGVMSKGFHWI